MRWSLSPDDRPDTNTSTQICYHSHSLVLCAAQSAQAKCQCCVLYLQLGQTWKHFLL
uniref:Uncharacterized protein n=1 Tax=Anguilla anguilla TaxID=7936 RepID=A0A0E9UKU5_ANGAN